MLKRKGGYSGDKCFPVKFHASRELRTTLMSLAEERQLAMACVVRGLVEKALTYEQPLPPWSGSRSEDS